MATIITVHGTAATGPEEGQAWWQKGSPFEKHIRELVESADGQLEFKPVIWDGANSETSRRKAAAKLYEEAGSLESKTQKYCLIGHSHGGSVIANSLLLAASKGNNLPNMTRLITVATPFIRSVKSFWLFTRSGPLGKSVLASAATLITLLATEQIRSSFKEAAPVEVTGAIITFVSLYAFTYLLNKRYFYMYSRKILRLTMKYYSPRFVCLRHESDEAVNGLKSLKMLNAPIFARNFAVSMMSFASLLVLPLLVLVWNFLWTEYKPSKHAQPSSYLDPLYVSLGFIAIVGLLVFSSLVITKIIAVLSTRVSSFLSVVFNRMTWRQLRRVGFGNDTSGELSVDADGVAPWLGPNWSPLPDQLAREIADASDKAASVAVTKFRNLINDLALSKDKETKAFFFSGYLTWDELIHCSYFNVPRFRMLVAYAIAHSEGFRPTEAFKSHPDYNLVAGWYEEIKPKMAQS